MNEITKAMRMSTYKTREPRTIVLATPTAEAARQSMRTWIEENCQRAPGEQISLWRFSCAFGASIDREFGPVLSLWFLQQNRVARVLHDLGVPVGYTRDGWRAVGNLQLRGSKSISKRRLIVCHDTPTDSVPNLEPEDYSGIALPDEPTSG